MLQIVQNTAIVLTSFSLNCNHCSELFEMPQCDDLKKQHKHMKI